MTCCTELWIYAVSILKQCRSMWNMTLEAVLIFHLGTVRFVTLKTLLELAMYRMACIAVELGMLAGFPLHVFKGPGMACGAHRLHILHLGKIKLHWLVRIMTPGTVRDAKMLALGRIMTFLAFRDHSFLVRRMLFMTVNALEIFKVAATLLAEGANNIIMAC